MLNLHDEMNGNRGVDGMEEEEEERLRELLLEEAELEEEEKKMQEKLSSEEAMALKHCSLCDALTDAQIVEILDASRTKSAFEYGEDELRERVYETRGGDCDFVSRRICD